MGWDGRADSGALVYSGRYRARITAQNEFGTVSLTAPFTWRIFVIWLPRWKWSNCMQSAIPSARSVSNTRIASLTVSPNFER